jgi:hypothetical protein
MYRFCRGFDSADATINNGPHLLDIGLKVSLGTTCDFSADTAEILGLASPLDVSSGAGLFTCKVTYSGHQIFSWSI